MSATQAIELKDEANSGGTLRFEFNGSEIRASITAKNGAKTTVEVSQSDRLALNKFLGTCIVPGRKQDA